jgi:CBS domain containing-hemolysin-like protein
VIIAAGISLATESLTNRISAVAAAFMLLIIMLIGVVFDIIGIAFASCDQAPFISMASKKIKRAKSAIKLLQNADIVTNICADVIGDVCGIVSGAVGAAIAIKISADSDSFIWGIVMSSLIAAITVSGRAFGKTVGLKKNKEIVSTVSYCGGLLHRKPLLSLKSV